MPLPSPKKNEAQQKFVSRCMGNEVMLKDFPDQKQRAAVCYSQYKKAKKAKASTGVDSEPEWEEQDFNGATIIW